MKINAVSIGLLLFSSATMYSSQPLPARSLFLTDLQILRKQLPEQKAASLLKYWKDPAQCVYEREYASVQGAPVKILDFSPDGKFLAYGTIAGEEIVDLRTGKNIWDNLGDILPCQQLAFSKQADTHLQLVDCALNHVRRSNIARIDDPEHVSLTQVDNFQIPFVYKAVVALSRDGKQKAVGGRSNQVQVWDECGNHKETRIPSESDHLNTITALAFSPDGNELAMGDSEAKVTLWNLTTGETTITPIRKANWTKTTFVSSLDFSPDGTRLVASFDSTYRQQGAIILWDRYTNQTYGENDTGAVPCAVFSPDGKIIAFALLDEGIVLMDVESHEIINTITSGRSIEHIEPESLKFSPDGKCIAAGLWSNHNTLAVWAIGAAPIRPIKTFREIFEEVKQLHTDIQQLPCMQHHDPT